MGERYFYSIFFDIFPVLNHVILLLIQTFKKFEDLHIMLALVLRKYLKRDCCKFSKNFYINCISSITAAFIYV